MKTFIKNSARNDLPTEIRANLTEWMGEDPNSHEWDTKSIINYGAKFGVTLSVARLGQMAPTDLQEALFQGAEQQIEKSDCSPIAKFLEPFYAEKQLAVWAKDKFSIQVDPMEFILDPQRKVRKPFDEVVGIIEQRARESYKQREIEYPIEHILLMVFGGDEGYAEDPYRAEYIRNWTFFKFRVGPGPQRNLDAQYSAGSRTGSSGSRSNTSRTANSRRPSKPSSAKTPTPRPL